VAHDGPVSIFDRRPALRWAVPAAAGALILAGSLVGAVGASADSGLVPKTAEELLVALQAPQTTAMSGTIEATADLGLPELPTMGGSSGTSATDLASGTHTLRVWLGGPDKARIAMIGEAQESDLVRNGRDLWTWSSADRSADHMVLPADDASKRPAAPSGVDLPSTPQEAAAQALAALEPTTEVTTSGTSSVAGRAAYELILTPKQGDTLVARVVIAMDAETNVPLRVQVYSTSMPDPAFQVGFTAVDFATPDDALFTFTPPPGTTVTEHAEGDQGFGPDHGSAPSSDRPTVVGTGWSQVVVGKVPADMGAGPTGDPAGKGPDSASGGDITAVLQSMPQVSGPWGSGRVLNGTLFSAILTDDGRIAVGAVTPETLGAALAAQ
jgi:outer membrane lipoprotein-sorting protein